MPRDALAHRRKLDTLFLVFDTNQREKSAKGRLVKIAHQSFFNRRELEWKLSLGFWAAIAAFTWLFFSVEGIQVPAHFSCILGIAYALLFGLTIPFWHLPLQKAHGGDKKYYFSYLRRARGVKDSAFVEGKGKWEDVDKWWFFGHLVFSFFFLALSWFVITQIAVPTGLSKSKQTAVSRTDDAEQKDAAELASAVSHMASQSRQPADLDRSATLVNDDAIWETRKWDNGWTRSGNWFPKINTSLDSTPPSDWRSVVICDE